MALLAGCSLSGSADTLDTGATERSIDKVIGGRITAGVDEIRCPDDIARGTGKVFRCRAILADGKGEVRLAVSQVDGDGKLDVRLLDAVVDHRAVAQDLRAALVEEHRRSFAVDCGAEQVDVVRPDDTFTCTASDEGGDRTVKVTVVDAAGTVRYEVGPA